MFPIASPLMRAASADLVGPRSYANWQRMIEFRYGSMDAFYEAHPNVIVAEAPRMPHAGGTADDRLYETVREAYSELSARMSSQPTQGTSDVPQSGPDDGE
jgi:hypothetical protein